MNDKIRINLETGLMIEAVHPSESGEDIIETPCLIPFYLPQWNGTEWVEGTTEFPAPQPSEPTQEQVMEDLIALLVESGVIGNV